MERIYAKGRNGKYCATGTYEDKKVIVLAGSRISVNCAKRINPIVQKLREDKAIVSKDMILLVDVPFRSPSTAATFVSGNMSNGRGFGSLNQENLWEVYEEKVNGRNKI